MTLRHIVLWKLAATDDAQRAADAARVVAELNALVGVVPSIRSLTVGTDVVGGANFDVGLVADFDDQDGLDAYQVHPAHQEVVGFVRSVVADRAACDFEL
ncbi:Dabb family protein [uncultured Microbacterium sp.]|jgi:Stress responsive A/B Barrel Domain|uniref:Dabb family protein n=1 Tax=uncultured Microbacterium sp. TaxID=191216 RepID=UPI0025CD528A|nr:Dabb family protein [uncultured Microbacterium sp.]